MVVQDSERKAEKPRTSCYETIMLGYEQNKKSYKLGDVNKFQFAVSRDILGGNTAFDSTTAACPWSGLRS
eukprot:IDg12846t1